MKNENNVQFFDFNFLIKLSSNSEKILENQEKLLSITEDILNKKNVLKNFITEEEAKKLVKKRTTWFWKLRKEGKIPFSRLGNKIFYDIEDIQRLLESNKEGGHHEK